MVQYKDIVMEDVYKIGVFCIIRQEWIESAEYYSDQEIAKLCPADFNGMVPKKIESTHKKRLKDR